METKEEMEARRAQCKHRWEETKFGINYWAPGTRQYTCARCGKMVMFTMGDGHGDNQSGGGVQG